MEPIIPPVSRHLLEEELTRERFVRYSSRGENKLYDFNAHEAPNTMREVGRLREIAFRAAGGGTGLASDIDSYDVSPEAPYRQLVVWDPKKKEILGGYRYIIGAGIKPQNLATYPIFSFSDTFVRDYLPYTIELGRSFVQPNYQNSNENRSGLYAL
nr:GNAT family N-acetyltransferase [Bacteroidales bacterium]